MRPSEVPDMTGPEKRSPAHQRGMGRREFLRRAMAGGATMAMPAIIPSSALGLGQRKAPSERIVIAGIGIGRRGRNLIDFLLPESDVQIVADADVRRERREEVKRVVDAHYGNGDCKIYRDYREVLARPDIDAVVIATGNRWHTMASIHAARAGKDIYCEKPISMTISESKALAATMEQYGTVFQAGTQLRSIGNYQFAVNLARSGKLGKVHTVHAETMASVMRDSWLPPEPEPPREECDWETWLGACPWRPYNSQLLNGWHHRRDFGSVLLDWGVHSVDICQWALDADKTSAVEYEPTEEGGIARYASGAKLVVRSSGWMGLGGCAVRFEGDEGWVEAGIQGEVRVHPASLLGERRSKLAENIAADNHGRDFLNCIRNRGLTQANHVVASNAHCTCHAMEISRELGRSLRWDPGKGEFTDDAANRRRSRAMREPWRL